MKPPPFTPRRRRPVAAVERFLNNPFPPVVQLGVSPRGNPRRGSCPRATGPRRPRTISDRGTAASPELNPEPSRCARQPDARPRVEEAGTPGSSPRRRVRAQNRGRGRRPGIYTRNTARASRVTGRARRTSRNVAPPEHWRKRTHRPDTTATPRAPGSDLLHPMKKF